MLQNQTIESIKLRRANYAPAKFKLINIHNQIQNQGKCTIHLY